MIIIQKYKATAIAPTLPIPRIILISKLGGADQYRYDKTCYIVEIFFAWPKNGFSRTRIIYGKNAENYLAFVVIFPIMMYFRVLV